MYRDTVRSGVAHRQVLILQNFNFALVENATVFKDLTIMKYRASYCPSPPRPCSLKLFKIQDKIHFSTKRNNAYINHMRCCPKTIFTHQYFLPPPRKNISQRWDCTYDDIGNAFFLVEWSYTQWNPYLSFWLRMGRCNREMVLDHRAAWMHFWKKPFDLAKCKSGINTHTETDFFIHSAIQ